MPLQYADDGALASTAGTRQHNHSFGTRLLDSAEYLAKRFLDGRMLDELASEDIKPRVINGDVHRSSRIRAERRVDLGDCVPASTEAGSARALDEEEDAGSDASGGIVAAPACCSFWRCEAASASLRCCRATSSSFSWSNINSASRSALMPRCWPVVRS